jgi:hypothetical protein
MYSQTGRAALACIALATAVKLYRAMDITFWLPAAEAYWRRWHSAATALRHAVYSTCL